MPVATPRHTISRDTPISKNTPAPTHYSATLYSDGSCPANPGPMGIGFSLAVTPEHSGATGFMVDDGYRLGPGTNNKAEYLALIAGLRSALRHGVSHIRCFSDSMLVVRQVRGEWEVKDVALKNLCDEAIGLSQMFSSFALSHIPREENTIADHLSKNPTDPAALPPDIDLDLNPPKARKMSRFDAARIQYWWQRRICQNEYRLARLFGVSRSFAGRIGRREQYKDITEADLERPRL